MASNTLTLESQSPPPSQSQFSIAIARIAVAQITQSVGFKASQSSALDTLTRLATLYLQSLGKTAASHAVDGGRTECNLFDVVHALESLNSPRGFPGATAASQCLLRSSTIKELSQFVHSTKELPFAKPIPKSRENLGAPVSLGKIDSDKKVIRGAEIPRWLPDFPEVREKEERKSEREESYWELKREEERDGEVKTMGKDEKDMQILPWRRDKVRFKIGGKKKRNGNVGKDLKLRKRVCLVNSGARGILKEDAYRKRNAVENGR
ncbi:hypothetical protein Ancab_015632 [Ancistrocladus abbreviatus]